MHVTSVGSLLEIRKGHRLGKMDRYHHRKRKMERCRNRNDRATHLLKKQKSSKVQSMLSMLSGYHRRRSLDLNLPRSYFFLFFFSSSRSIRGKFAFCAFFYDDPTISVLLPNERNQPLVDTKKPFSDFFRRFRPLFTSFLC
jgi:hypothetical protein